MGSGCHDLTEKEKQTLRLLLGGYDAKSMARHLGLSVHTINERLRDARRKLGVSSSREAARMLREHEGADPDFLADKHLRGAAAPLAMSDPDPPHDGARRQQRLARIIGGTIMSLLLATLALAVMQPDAAPSSADAASPAVDLAASPIVSTARSWLELGDAGDWQRAYDATGSNFHKSNTLQHWTDVSRQVRVPLGAVISRRAISLDDVPAPPRGVEVVKFKTTFANKADVTETVALAREGGVWKIVGCYIE